MTADPADGGTRGAPGEPEITRWDWPHWAINTTIRCQHRCIYCFEGDRAGMRNVPPDETREVLRRAASEVPVVIFMGAEPTLNRDLVDLTRFATDLGLHVGYSTNALKFADADFLARCLDAGLHILEVSFHYPDAATYQAITRARPEGFERLLRALSNIEAANRARAEAGAARVPVNVNVVVSAFNVSRIEAVVGHVAGRFSRTPWVLTFKRVSLADAAPEVAARSRVRLGTLREAFSRLPDDLEAHWGAVLAMFRDFPLCALPGREHLDATLAAVLAGTRVMDNFDDQVSLKAMYPEESRRTDHPFSRVCASCRLDPWCVSRGLFREGAPGGTDPPIPMGDAIPAGLARLVEACERVRDTRG